MTRVSELIDLIVQGKNAEASDVLNSELLSRSYEAINEYRPHIAAEYFGSVADSLLGAAGMGDIGQYFPSEQKEWENAKSEIFLIEVKNPPH